jgi:hypothetical protein
MRLRFLILVSALFSLRPALGGQLELDNATTSIGIGAEIIDVGSVGGVSSTTALNESYTFGPTFDGFSFSGTGNAAISNNLYDPTITASVSGSIPYEFNGNDPYFSSNVSLYYYFEIAGPTGQTVPIDIASSGLASTTGGDTSKGHSAVGALTLVVQTINGTEIPLPGGGSFGFNSNTAFGEDDEFSLTSGTQYEVQMNVSASLENISSVAFSGTASAYIDPSISIDPSFTNPAYSLEFSPNLVVPEPSTISLLAFGGMMGLLLKRTRKPLTPHTPPQNQISYQPPESRPVATVALAKFMASVNPRRL